MRRVFVVLFSLALPFVSEAQNQRKILSLPNELKAFESQKSLLGANAPMSVNTTKVLLPNELNMEGREVYNKRVFNYATRRTKEKR